LKYFLTLELIRWPSFEELYRPELSQIDVFSSEEGVKLWAELKKRVVAHVSIAFSPFSFLLLYLDLIVPTPSQQQNVRVIAGYYTAITSARLSELLDLPQEEAEKALADLVVSKLVYAKINRPKGVVSFTKPKDPNEHLNDWSTNISNLLDLMERTTHLISRDILVHSVQKK
jgi:26S proteasome regulatory subunit N5